MRFKEILVIVFLLLSACEKTSKNANTKLLGHAGNGMKQWNGMYSANSLEGIKYALNLDNCAGIEVDIRISKDTTFWLFHNDALDLVTTKKGCVHSKSDEELKKTKYKTIHQESLVTLDDLLQLKTTKEIVLDVKNFDGCTEQEIDFDFIKRGFERIGTLPPNYKIKMNTLSIYPYLQNLGSKTILEVDAYSDIVPLYSQNSIDAFMLSAEKISAEEIKSVQAKGFKIYLYGVRSGKKLKNELKKQPDYILVDDVLNSIITW